MNILWEISEKSNDIITLLDSNGFFDKPQFKHFCPKSRLKIELEIRMKEKWDSGEDFHLSNSEFENVICTIVQDEVSETLYDLIESNRIQMSVNNNGKIVYSLTDDTSQYFSYDNGILKLLRARK